MADTDILIKDLPLTETVNDSDDIVTEDSSPTTHRVKSSVFKNYINSEQNEELDGLKVDLDNVNSNIGSLSSKVDDATTAVSSMQTNLNTMDGRVTANADGISELNSALAYHKGDVISYESFAIGMPGTIQTDGTCAECTLFLDKPVESDVSSVTINPIQIVSLMTTSGRIIGNATDFTDYTFDTTILPNAIRIRMIRSSSYGATNYTPCFLQIYMRVVFS